MAGDALPTDKSVGYYLSSLWDYGPLGLHLQPFRMRSGGS